MIRKRSISLNGHATSVSLEDEFWRELQRIAKAEEIPLSALVARIDAARVGENLSSSLRLAVLADLRERPVSRA